MCRDEFMHAQGLTCLSIYLYSGGEQCVVDLRVRFARVDHPAIQTAAVEWGDQTSVTPVLEKEQIPGPLLWTPSSLWPLKRRPVSTLISPETTSICRMGTACYMQDPRAVGTASACVISHYFCPLVLPISQPGEGKVTNLEGCWVCCQRRLVKLTGLVIKWRADGESI